MNTTPIESEQLELPQLKRAAWEPGLIHVSVPVSGSLEEIGARASPLLTDRDFFFETPVGEAKLTIAEVEVFQSEKSVVLGLAFSADLPGEMFSTKGIVYLAATPGIDPETQELFLDNIRFARALDNDLWELLSAVFEGKILTTLREKLRYELSEDIAKIETLAFEKLNEPDALPGLKLKATRPKISLSRPLVSDGNIIVVVNTQTQVDAMVGRDLLSFK